MDDGPPGLAIDAAQRIVLTHVHHPCSQCKGRRCWMLESAVRCVMFGGEEIDPTLHAAVTDASRKIAEAHKPGDDKLCSPCLLRECEPWEFAIAWLQVIGEPFQPAEPRTVVDVLTPDLAEARRLVKAHQGYGCPQCTPDGCPAEDAAVPVVFQDVVSRLDAPRRVAPTTTRGRVRVVVHRIDPVNVKRTKCGEKVTQVQQSPTEGTTRDPAKVTCHLCR